MTEKHSPKRNENVDKNNNRRVKQTQDSITSGKLTDFKLTLITNSILLGVIAFLLTLLFKNEKIHKDCGSYYQEGARQDGIYMIQPNGNLNTKINVFCNMSAGGLTMLFRRTKNSGIDFQKQYSVYKAGFGDLNTDHFIGLDNMNLLTREGNRQLIAVMNGTQYRYSNFKVLSEFYHYKLVIEDEIDKYMDGCSLLRLNNSLFSTIDVDYDLASNSNCSSGWKAGWWFTDCFDHSLCMTCLIMHGNSGVKNLDNAAFLIK